MDNSELRSAFISIGAAVLMIGVGISRESSQFIALHIFFKTSTDLIVAAPGLHLNATVHTSLTKAFLSVSNITFAYAGHVAFFSSISEFKNPKDFHKVLFLYKQ
jgi:hypothetical protein